MYNKHTIDLSHKSTKKTPVVLKFSALGLVSMSLHWETWVKGWDLGTEGAEFIRKIDAKREQQLADAVEGIASAHYCSFPDSVVSPVNVACVRQSSFLPGDAQNIARAQRACLLSLGNGCGYGAPGYKFIIYFVNYVFNLRRFVF